jgi:hypothetical protein
MVDTALPPQYSEAAEALTPIFKAQPLPADANGNQSTLNDIAVNVSRGVRLQNFNDDATKDTLQITVKSPSFAASSVTASAAGEAILKSLNGIEALRNEVIMVSPKDYLEQVKTEMGDLLKEARKLNISGSNADLESWKGLDPQYAQMQVTDYAAKIIENPQETMIRIQIPTNPLKPAEALKDAEIEAKKIETALPEIKEQMIRRIQEKNYIPNMTPELIANQKEHSFEVSTQQQDNQWTNVFVTIRSPEQKYAKEHPDEVGTAEKPKKTPEELKKTNMISMITDEKNKGKLATRSVLFKGKEPTDSFVVIAGTRNMEDQLGKIMHHLVEAKPELVPRVKALLNENVFKRRQDWNIAPDQRDIQKKNVSARIDPDSPDTLKITLPVSKGTADDIVSKIAALTKPQVIVPESTVKTDAAAASLEAAIAAVLAAPPAQAQAAAASSVEIAAPAGDIKKWVESVATSNVSTLGR